MLRYVILCYVIYIYHIIYPSSQVNSWLVLCLGHRVRFTLGPGDASCTLVSAPRGAAVPGLRFGGHGEVLGDHSAMCGAPAGGTSEAAGGEGKICGETPGLPGWLGAKIWMTLLTFFQLFNQLNSHNLGVSENSVPLNPMVNDHYPY